MKIKKIIIALTIMLSLITTNVYAAPSNWASASVNTAIGAGLVPNTLQNNYQNNITRAQFCDLIVKLFEAYTGESIADILYANDISIASNPFNDTSSSNVNACFLLGIVNGKSAGIFDPNGSLTRQEAAKILTVTIEYFKNFDEKSNIYYADQNEMGSWAKSYIEYVTDNGIMNGYKVGTNYNFSPRGNYTIEQAIVTILRVYQMIINDEAGIDINKLVSLDKVTLETYTIEGGNTKLYSDIPEEVGDLEIQAAGQYPNGLDIAISSVNDNEMIITIGDAKIVQNGYFTSLSIVNLYNTDEKFIMVYYRKLDGFDYAKIYQYSETEYLNAIAEIVVSSPFENDNIRTDKNGRLFGAYDVVNGKITGYTSMETLIKMRRNLTTYPISNVRISDDMMSKTVRINNEYVDLDSDSISTYGLGVGGYVTINGIKSTKATFTPTGSTQQIDIVFTN